MRPHFYASFQDDALWQRKTVQWMSANELAVQSVRQFVVKTGEPNDMFEWQTDDQANIGDMSSVRILLPKVLDELHHSFVLFLKEFWTHSPKQLLVRLILGQHCSKPDIRVICIQVISAFIYARIGAAVSFSFKRRNAQNLAFFRVNSWSGAATFANSEMNRR